MFIQNTSIYKIKVKQMNFDIRFPDYSSSLKFPNSQTDNGKGERLLWLVWGMLFSLEKRPRGRMFLYNRKYSGEKVLYGGSFTLWHRHSSPSSSDHKVIDKCIHIKYMCSNQWTMVCTVPVIYKDVVCVPHTLETRWISSSVVRHKLYTLM